jgi:amino acid adenylation domain-containing protein/non-ribosomal peptide synthase protein (TIGR01720 family)
MNASTELFVLPASFSQERLWVLDRLEPGSPVYNLPASVRLRGALDAAALARSLERIVERHEVLRTTFAVAGGSVVQVIRPQLRLALPRVDLAALGGAELEREVERRAVAEGLAAFDLAAGPLLRATLLRLDARQHVLLLTLHHIVSDGWSLGVLIAELSACYGAIVAGRSPALTELPIQYGDFALWQRDRLTGAAAAAEVSYWREKLAGLSAGEILAPDHRRGAAGGPQPLPRRSTSLRLDLAVELSARLRGLCRGERVTVFTALLAAFMLLLYRHSGQPDIAVGSPVAGRDRKETSGLIGVFLNTVVLRVILAGELSLRELLARVWETVSGAFAHQALPYERVLEELRGERGPGQAPLFQSFFNMLSFPRGALQLPSLTAEYLASPEIGAKFDLTVYAEDRDERICCRWVYDARLFDAARVQEMVDQYHCLLERIVEQPPEPIGRISLLTARAAAVLPDPRRTLDDRWHGSIGERLSFQAARRPGKIAVADRDGEWTYADLEARADRLARGLVAAGIGAEQVVAISGHRGAALVAAVLGVLKAGAAYTILDPGHPAARLVECLRLVDLRGWIEIEEAGSPPPELLDHLDQAGVRCRIRCSRRDAAPTAAAGGRLGGAPPSRKPAVALGPESLACISFTSGSTGKPKGVMARHGPLTHFQPWQGERFGLDETDRYSMLSGLSHDPLQRDMFTPIWFGATLCVPDPDRMGLPGWLAEWMRAERITVAHLTPAMGRLLTDTAPAGLEVTSLRWAFYVGEALTRQDTAALGRLAPAATCVNYYGSTETQRAVSFHVVAPPGAAPAEEAPNAPWPLGHGMQDVQLLVINAGGGLAGVGELGEIQVRSPHLARGYLAASGTLRFRSNPFTGDAGDRLYCTGDLGRYLPDGAVEMAGRVDDQLQIRGFRVEPAEVQAALAGHPAIHQSVVVAVGEPAVGRVLAAYYVAHTAPPPSPDELRTFLCRLLPDYMVPAAFVLLGELPRLPNGKVDRQALPPPEEARSEPTAGRAGPLTPIGEIVAVSWGEVLGVSRIQAHDNFFALGGQSLLATRLVSRLQEGLGIPIPLRVIFDAPRLAEQAERITLLLREGRPLDAPPLLARAALEGEVPLSFAQQRLWLLHRLDPASAAYNIAKALAIEGPLAVPALDRGLAEIARRHQILRTTLPEVAGRPLQRIHPKASSPLRRLDLSALPPARRLQERGRLLAEAVARPFDLAARPPWQVHLLVEGRRSHVLLCVMHHVVTDGWSMGVFVGELAQLYRAFAAGEPSPLPELPVQYADFAGWQREWLRGTVLETELAYWRQRLAGAPQSLALPLDRPRPSQQTSRCARLPWRLEGERLRALRVLGRGAGATLFMTLAAGLQALLHRYCGQDDLLIGTPVANRNRSEIEGMIGLFVNTLVLRASLAAEIRGQDLLRQVRETALGAYAHQELPFEKVVEALGARRDLSQTPLIQVLLVLQSPSRDAAVELPGLALRDLPLPATGAQLDLTLALLDGGAEVSGHLEHNADLFDSSTLKRFGRHLERLLAQLAADPWRPVASLALLEEAEAHQIRAEWNDTATHHAAATGLQTLIEEQVRRSPEAVAVVFEGASTSYGELAARANQLAHRLRRWGVAPDTLVGVCAERSLELVVGLLGVLKAGAAYVPLDPSYPSERLAFLLEDTRVAVILTQASVVAALPKHGCRTLRLDADRLSWAGEPRHDPPPVAGGDSLAYAIHTSGSTGRPKGAMNSHGAICNRLLWMQETYGLGAGDRVLQKTPFSFDVSVWELFWPLLAGARLVVARPGGHQDPTYLVRLIRQEGITTLHFVPSMLHAFLQEPGIETLASLRLVICSGEALASDLAQACRSRLAAAQLHNLYGPTEAAVDVTAWTCEAGGARSGVPIGRPIANLYTRVLDRGLLEAPVGVAGELFLGGAGLGRGYLHRPALTAERFLPDPHGRSPGGRLYRTGDLARHLAGGEIEFLGRLDQQVKLRGFRIEPGEIEAVLGAHPGIAETAVVLRLDPPGTPRLVAYYVARRPAAGAAAPAAGELRSLLRSKLPAHMVPAFFVALDALPLSPNGKLDRGALPDPNRLPADPGQDTATPRTPAERLLAEIWCRVLSVDAVGIHTNFFESGGDSILGLQVAFQANREGLHLAPGDIFRHQTIAELALAGGTAAPAQPPATVTGEVPPTPIQSWFFAQRRADPHHFNQSVLLRADLDLDARCLAGAVRPQVAHHDALRLRVGSSGGDVRQEIAPPGEAPCHRIDLSALPPACRPAALEWAAARVQTTLDLAAGPLCRVCWFRCEAASGRLLVAIHHLAVDGVSWRILLADLATAYGQLAAGATVALPAKTTSFQEWAERLRQHAASAAVHDDAPAWRALLAGFHPPLPADHPDGLDTAAAARVLSTSLDREETAALLRDVPGVYRTRIDEVLLTAVAQAFASWTGRASLLLDLEGHGREDLFQDVDLSRTVGWFTVLYPMVLDLAAAHGPGQALRAVKERLRGAPGHGLSYGLLRFGTGGQAPPDPPGDARAEILFNYLGQLDAALPEGSPFSAATESRGPLASPRSHRSHTLEVGGSIGAGRLHLTLGYGANRHDRATMEALLAGIASRLRALIDHCLSPEAGGYSPSDFPLARCGQQTLDRLLGADRDVEDLYPLTGMQQGMLFDRLYAGHGDTHFQQFTCELIGELDAGALEAAWQAVVARHPALRTAFHWERLEQPVQVVRRRVRLPVVCHDWSDCDAGEAARRQEELLSADRRRGFDLASAPLMRLHLVRLSPAMHRLVWSRDHLLLDGWSVQQVIREVLAAYDALAHGRAPDLAPRRPFRDYVRWLEGRDRAADEEFWRRTLQGCSGPTRLCAKPPGPAGAAPAAAVAHAAAPTPLAQAMQAFARHRRLTVNTLVQGAWALLLERYGGASDLVFGVTVAGRPAELEGAESMIGLLINTLPTRVRCGAGETLLPWLESLQARQVEMRAHGAAPLADVQRWSGLPRDEPLFETLLVFENYPLEAGARRTSGGIEVRSAKTLERAGYPLALAVFPGDGLSWQVLFHADRYDRPWISRLTSHLENLLADMIRRPEQRLAELQMLAASERQQLVVEVNDTSARYPWDATIHGLFAQQTAARPEATAVSCATACLSYGELARQSDRLAAALRSHGVGPEVTVGVCVERCTATMVALLAILAAGGAYLALDPADPRRRLDLLIREAGVALVLTMPHLAAALPAGAAVVLTLSARGDGEPPALQPPPGSALAVPAARAPRPPRAARGAATADNLAAIFFTSGTTGRPKAVAITHRNVLRLACGAAGYAALGANAVFLQFAPLSFDASTFEIWGCLLHGGRLVMAPPRRLSLEELRQVIDSQAITAAWLTAGLFHQMVEAGLPSAGSLGQLLAGGEVLSPEHVARVLRAGSGPALVNGYGPTEGTTFTCCQRVLAAPAAGAAVPIGRPVANTRVLLLDDAWRPVPVGIVGELFLGGAGLARGYLNRPELTAEHFVPDPWAAGAGGRLYRTGDTARWLPDGTLDFAGRRDSQVKVRGFRIELGEIEAALRQIDGVDDAAVLLLHGETPGDAGQRLAAYVAAADPLALGAGTLRRALQDRLPAHMVPQLFATLPALPLTATGKVDRRALGRALPAAACSAAAPGEHRAAPQGPVEELLAGIWEDLLHVEWVGRHDDFFALGGHSLLATRVLSRLRETFHAELPLRNFFESPTVAGLATALAGAASAGREPLPAAPQAPIPRLPRDRDLPLSFAQERLWLLDRLHAGSPLYNVPRAVRFKRPLAVAVLRGCLAEVVRRHETLRTRFAQGPLGPLQVVAPASMQPLPVIDLGALPQACAESEGRRLAASEARRPFDLTTLPLLRCALLRLAADDHVMLLTVHHIVCDGWSMEVLVRELTVLYGALAAARPSPLPELAIQYADFGVWQRRWLEDGELERQLGYWQTRLAGAPTSLLLPGTPAAGDAAGRRWSACRVTLPAETGQAVRELGHRHAVTPFMTFLAALGTVLWSATGQEDIVIGANAANRNRFETEGLVGFFVNMLPLRIDLSGNPSFLELLARVRDTVLGAYERQDTPFQTIVQRLNIPRQPGREPLVQLVVDYQVASRGLPAQAGVEPMPGPDRENAGKFDLQLVVTQTGDDFACSLTYKHHLLGAAAAGRLLRRLELCLARAPRHPELAVRDIREILAEHDRQLDAANRARFDATRRARPHALRPKPVLTRHPQEGDNERG